VISLWEVVIKSARPRGDFRVDAVALRRGLLRGGFREVPLTAAHALAVAALPQLHHDPFDRALVAQARVEGAVLLTADRALAAYGAPVLVCDPGGIPSGDGLSQSKQKRQPVRANTLRAWSAASPKRSGLGFVTGRASMVKTFRRIRPTPVAAS